MATMPKLRYRTVVPLNNFEINIRKPFHFSPNVTIERIPGTLRKDKQLERLAQYDRERLDACTHSLVFHYEAEGLYSADPNWKGKEPRTIEKANGEAASLANLAFWLQHPSPLGFSLTFHMPEFTTFVIQASEVRDRFLCHPDNKDERVTRKDLKPAKELFAALTKIPRETSVWTAIRALIAALQMNVEEIRYLLLWVALEALFGAPSEITYRISERLAFFIGKNKAEKQSLFSDAKKGYGFRSKVAHGAWKKNKDSTALTATSEGLLRRALVRLLLDDNISKHFLGKDDARNKYLDELVFL